MRKLVIAVVLLAALGLAAPAAQAGPVLSWAELAFKSSADGLVYDNPYGSWAPAGADLSAFSLATGLGSIKYTFSGVGTHYVVGFFDYDFTEPSIGNGLFDESGVIHGAPAAGQSWEIDDSFLGSIYSDFSAFDDVTPLLNSNALSGPPVGDVAVALGYTFTLALGDPDRDVFFNVSLTAPSSGYYLEHKDPMSGNSVYFSHDLGGGGPVIPEPGTLTLLGLGLAAAARRLRRRT